MNDRKCATRGCRNTAQYNSDYCMSCDQKRDQVEDEANRRPVTIGTDHSHFYTTRTETTGELPKMNSILERDS